MGYKENDFFRYERHMMTKAYHIIYICRYVDTDSYIFVSDDFKMHPAWHATRARLVLPNKPLYKRNTAVWNFKC